MQEDKVIPFSLRFAERVEETGHIRSSGAELFGDPTTVDATGEQTDPHTDEG